MGLLGRKSAQASENLGTTVISQGTVIEGEINLDAKLHLDGTFQGSITSSNDISIGASGHFEGTVNGRTMLISGYAKGTFECDRLEITDTGKVYGEVIAEEFVIEPGGRFVGGSRSPSDEPVPALSHQASQLPAGGVKTVDKSKTDKAVEGGKVSEAAGK